MKDPILLQRFVVLMPLLLLCACGGDRPQPQNAPPPQPAQKTVAIPKPTRLWPQASVLQALPNYGKTSRDFTRVQNASAGETFFRAYQAHQPGKWDQKGLTIEGDPVFTRFYYLGKGSTVYIEHDTRQDQWSVTDWVRQWCDRLISLKSNQSIFRQEGCHSIDAVRKAGR